MTFYRQCNLKKGDTVEVAWIPEQFAVTGNFIRIGDDGGLWSVIYVGSSRKDERFLTDHERDYLKHRSRTDI